MRVIIKAIWNNQSQVEVELYNEGELVKSFKAYKSELKGFCSAVNSAIDTLSNTVIKEAALEAGFGK